MRILMVHNKYRVRGGEDESAESEAGSLQDCGLIVETVQADNRRIRGLAAVVATALGAVWSQSSYRRIRSRLNKKQCEVIHVQNFFPLISPAVYYAAKAERVPVIQTLRNYRLLCPAATFYRDGHVCEDCLGKRLPWPGIRHACYRNSHIGTAAVAGMIAIHNLLRTWIGKVDLYIALSRFSREKFIAGGLPATKIVVKPNCLHGDPGVGAGHGGFGLFVGRLTREKGVGTLVEAWKRLDGRIPLKIVGEGPMAAETAAMAAGVPGVELLGRRSLEDVYALMGDAAFLVFPTEWYETFGRVIIEAFAKGTPVVASDIGAVTELIDSGRTGLLFRCGDAVDLAAKVGYLLDCPDALAAMRREVRAEFEAKYTSVCNGELLLEIYDLVVNGVDRAQGELGTSSGLRF
jgi:glycosyltransferase involved in cell wall biosynthesis